MQEALDKGLRIVDCERGEDGDDGAADLNVAMVFEAPDRFGVFGE